MAEDQADYTISVSNPAAGNAPKINTSTPIEGQQGAIIGDVHQAGTVQPDDVSQTRQVVAPDQLPLEYQYDEEQINKTMALAVQSDIQDHTEEELIKDPTFSYASKKMFRMQRGEDFTGSDEEANQYGIDLMRSVDNNLISLGDFTAEVSNMSQEDAMTALYMMDMFEAKNFTGKGIAEAFGYMAIDPTTYAGLATFGWAFAGKEAAKVGAKASMRKVLQNKIFSATGAATVEGGLYGSGFEHMKQKVNEYGGEEYSGSDVAVVGVAGAVLSGTAAKYLPKAFEWGGEKAQKMWQKYGAKRTPKAGISAGEGMNTEAIPTELVKAAAGGDTEAAKALTSAVFERNFQRIIDHNTGDQLKPMLLQKLKDNPDLIEQLAKKYNYEFKYFSHNPDSVGKKIGDGVVEAPPKSKQQLTKKGYNDGKVWVYDPLDTHGAFDDAEYTKAWRQVHELAHAITEHFMQEKYGDSRRFGALGFDIKNPYDAEDPRTYKGLNLSEAQRAIEWEDVAFRTQVELLKDLGIPVNEKEALDDWNIAGSDTLVRVLTGDFSDPAQHGVITDGMSEKIKTKDVLQVLENQEHLMAHEEGRSPTLGTDLHEWQQVTDEALKENIGNFTKRGKADTVNISVESITGEASLNPEFKKHLDANPDLKAEYHKEIEPIVDEIFADSGLDVVKKTDTSGLWKDGVNPSTQYEVKIPKGGTTPEFQQQIEKTAMELAEVLEQDGVGYNVVTPREHKADGSLAEDANGFVLSGGKQLEDADLIKFNDLLLEKYPDGNIALVTTADGVKVFDWTEKPVKASDLIKTVDDIMHNLSLKYNIDQADINGQVAMPDWKGIANGTKSTKTKNTTGADRQASSGISGSGRQNDVQGQDLRSRVKAIQEKYSNKVSPKDKLQIPYKKVSRAADVMASDLSDKAKQKKLNAMMRTADPAKKQELIKAMQSLKPKKAPKKAPEQIKEQEEFNNHFYSKAANEYNKISDTKIFADAAAVEKYLKDKGVKSDELKALRINEVFEDQDKITGSHVKSWLDGERTDEIIKETWNVDSGNNLDRDDWVDHIEVDMGYEGGAYLRDPFTHKEIIVRRDDIDGYVRDDDDEVFTRTEITDELWGDYKVGDGYYNADEINDELRMNGLENDVDDPQMMKMQYFEMLEESGKLYERWDNAYEFNADDYEISGKDLEAVAEEVKDQLYRDYREENSIETYQSWTVPEKSNIADRSNYRLEVYRQPANERNKTYEPHFTDAQGYPDEANENVAVHVRVTDLKDAAGKNGTVLDEVQAQGAQNYNAAGGDNRPIPTRDEKAAAAVDLEKVEQERKEFDKKTNAMLIEIHDLQKQAQKMREENRPNQDALRDLQVEINEELADKISEIDITLSAADKQLKERELRNHYGDLFDTAEDKYEKTSYTADPKYKELTDQMDAINKERNKFIAGSGDMVSRRTKLLEIIEDAGNLEPRPHMTERSTYNKVAVFDQILIAAESGKDYFGWINGHLSNGSAADKTVLGGMIQNYDVEMPRMLQKELGIVPYKADYGNGKPILEDGEKSYWKPAKEITLFDVSSKKEGTTYVDKEVPDYRPQRPDGKGYGKWYWRFDITPEIKAKLKDAKIEMYGVGGAALVGANGVSLEGDDDGTK